MKENFEFMQDFALTLPQVLTIEKICEESQDAANQKAKSNSEMVSQFDDHLGQYQDLEYEFNDA